MHQAQAYCGMDVHQDSITIALMTETGDFLPTYSIPYRQPKIQKHFEKLVKRHPGLVAAYEAGGCGFDLCRTLRGMGIYTEVIAPSRIEKALGKPKNDKFDAALILKHLIQDRVSVVYMGSKKDEAVREVTRYRESLTKDLRRKKAKLLALLRRHGVRYTEGKKNWTLRYWAWLNQIKLDEEWNQYVLEEFKAEIHRLEAKRKQVDLQIREICKSWDKGVIVRVLCALRGIDIWSAASIVSEIMQFSRFQRAFHFMAFLGLLPTESSSGKRVSRGAISRMGNSQTRRLLVETGHHFRRAPNRASVTLQNAGRDCLMILLSRPGKRRPVSIGSTIACKNRANRRM